MPTAAAGRPRPYLTRLPDAAGSSERSYLIAYHHHPLGVGASHVWDRTDVTLGKFSKAPHVRFTPESGHCEHGF